MAGCQDWHVLSSRANWRRTIGARTSTPHKTADHDIPLLTIPGMRTSTIFSDPMHTFHLGWGQDLAASGVCMLAYLEYFGLGALDTRMQRAYEAFVEYCTASRKTTSCDKFSKQCFDMKSLGFAKLVSSAVS